LRESNNKNLQLRQMDRLNPISAQRVIENIIRETIPAPYYHVWRVASLSPDFVTANNGFFFASPLNKIFKESPYEFDLAKGANRFQHFTSISNLLSIINEKRIRMYDLNNMEDPREFELAADAFKSYAINMEEMKSCLFSFSMLPFTERRVEDEFLFWKMYGLDGMGAAIILNISSNNQFTLPYYLGKISYEKNPILKFESIKEKIESVGKKSDFAFGDLYRSVLPYLCFHKANFYSFENEVRIMSYIEKEMYEEHKSPIEFTINKKFKKIYYDHIPLIKSAGFNEIRNATEQWLDVKIEKVILGFQIPSDRIQFLISTISKLALEKLGYQVEVVPSELRNHFKTR